MKTILPLLRIAAKASFIKIKKESFFSPALDEEIFISRSFYRHITQKPRDVKDMAERLAMFPLVSKIIKNGYIASSGGDYIKISYRVHDNYLLSCIVYKEKTKKAAISCFRDFHVQKK